MQQKSVYQHLPYMTFDEILDLTGKTAVVTGGGDGIGLAISRRLAEAGANVVIGSRTLKDVTKELLAEEYETTFVKTDVSRQEDVENLIEMAVRTYGAVDILVNNAGVYPLRPIHEITQEFWDSVYAVNVRGTFQAAQAASRQMIEQKTGGSIVNLSSICGHRPMPNHCSYDSSKGAVLSMTRNLAKDLGRYGIRVNSISPGLIATPGNLEPTLLEEHEKMNTLQNIALKRRGEPYEIANAVLFLASPMSSYVSGADLLVDAGWSTNL